MSKTRNLTDYLLRDIIAVDETIFRARCNSSPAVKPATGIWQDMSAAADLVKFQSRQYSLDERVRIRDAGENGVVKHNTMKAI